MNIDKNHRGHYEVTINEKQYQWASYAGIIRQWQAESAGLIDAYGAQIMDSYQIHIAGAVGEFVASCVLGVPWLGPGTFKGDDIVGCQVRSTLAWSNNNLILHPKDRDNDPFILVTPALSNGTPKHLRWEVWGWIMGRVGKDQKWYVSKGNNRPAYFVPNKELLSMDSLVQKGVIYRG